MGNKVGYSDEFKVDVLDAYKRIGNVSEVCKQYEITRATFYNWQKTEEAIRGRAKKDKTIEVLAERGILSGDVLKDVYKYEDLLKQIGIVEERKRKLGHKVEHLLFQVVDLLENHESLNEIHPKDLSKIMTDLEGIRQKMYNEPDVIIEMRDEYQKNVMYVLRKMGLDQERLMEFVKHMKALEADYEVLK
jgi:predicted  nucleic acid-binding Zn-ribbon protein